MNDLIDRKKLLLDISTLVMDTELYTYFSIKNLVMLQPAVDTERHAHWEQPSYFDEENNVFQCSNCKEEFVLISGSPKENEYNYCPHCGCKMNETTNNDN